MNFLANPIYTTSSSYIYIYSVCVCVYIYIYIYILCVCVCIYIYIYIYNTMEYYLAIKKNKILPFATTWIDLEGIMLNEISETQKDKYCMTGVHNHR